MGVDAVIRVVVPGEPLEEQSVRRLSADMTGTLGAENFFIQRIPVLAGDPPRHALEVADGSYHGVYELPVSGQQIAVSVWSRYYGVGYERGDWPLLRSVMEFLSVRLPQASVYYGGDSDDELELFTREMAAEMDRHFYSAGHSPYRSYFGSGSTATCAFCADRPMNNSGGGGNQTFFSCDGCGLKRIAWPGGSEDLAKNEDFFAGAQRLRAAARA